MARDRINIEWKGRLTDRGPSLDALTEQLQQCVSESASDERGYRDGGSMKQVDTYFRVTDSRLKLREIDGKTTELIWYRRDNNDGTRSCVYRRLAVSDPRLVTDGLRVTLGIETQVVKVRRLFWWRGVRLHLDRVQDLGDFIEFEAVLGPDETQESGHERLSLLLDRFELDQSAAIATSYRALMLEHESSVRD